MSALQLHMSIPSHLSLQLHMPDLLSLSEHLTSREVLWANRITDQEPKGKSACHSLETMGTTVGLGSRFTGQGDVISLVQARLSMAT